MKSDDLKILSESILDILVKASEKFVKKNSTEPHVLSALQVASINFLGSVITANSRALKDKCNQLDFVEYIKTDVNYVFDQIKILIKTVDLH